MLYLSFNEYLAEYKLNKNLIMLLFLFPSWHFFSSFPGKDSIILLAIGLFYFSLIKKKFFYLIISITLMYLVRPHIMFLTILITSFLWINDYLLKKNKNKIIYIFFLLILSLSILFSIKILNPNYFEHIINFVEKGNLYRSYSSQFDGWYETGSNPIINSFLYLFYPLFDFSSLFRIIISLENLTIVSLILLAVIKFNKKSFLEIIKKKKFF